MHYSIRLTLPHQADSTARLKDFTANYKNFLFTGHSQGAERPHYHVYIESDLKNQALRKRIKTAFPECVGNKGYSIKELDEQRLDEHLRYLCRDEEPGVVMSSMNEETITNYNNEYYEKQEEFKKEQKKISLGSTFEIIKWIEQNPEIIKSQDDIRCNFVRKTEGYNPLEIGTFIFEYYMRKKNMLPSKWIFRQLIDTIYMRLATENDYEGRRSQLISEYLD